MRINAIIVTFNPSQNVIRLINALKQQNVIPIVVDNGSEDFDFAVIQNDLDCNLLKLEKNLGIASAQNIGVEKAVELGAEYILFFDQDSEIPEGFVKDMMDDYKLILSQNNKIGALGPRFIDERDNFYYKMISISAYGLRTKYDVSNIKEPFNSVLLISSGSLLSVETLSKVGLMRDQYFIDYVDTEWCIRAEALGFKNYISSKAIMYHTIGDSIKKNKFFRMPMHSPFRRYHIIRNTLYMFKEPHVPNFFVIQQLIINLTHQLFIICSAKGHRLEHLRYLIKGLKDGFKYLFRS